MTSERTKHCKKMRNIFGVVSFGLLIGLIAFIAINIINSLNVDKESVEILAQPVKDKIVAFGTTLAIGFICFLFIKEKARTFLFMICIVIMSIMKGEVGMYVSMSIYAADEFVFYKLFTYYKNKVSINKEIDLR